MIETHRECIHCKQVKPIREFVRFRVFPNPYDYICLECRGSTYDNVPHAFVYVLVDPRDSQMFYVGSSVNLRQRLSDHVGARKQTTNPRKGKRITAIVRSGLYPLIVPIEETSIEKSNDREQYWIECLAKAGAPLTNCSQGHPRRYVVDDYTP